MIALTGVSFLEALLAAPAATTNPTFYVSHAIADASQCFAGITPVSGSLSGATPVTLVAAPTPTDLRHDVRDVTIFNVDTQTNTITVQIDVSTVKYKIWSGDVPAGGSVRLENSTGRWTIYNVSGIPIAQSANSLETLVQTFTFATPSPLDFGTLNSGDIIVEAKVEITTVFDDPSTIVTLGLSTATGSILNSAEINPLVVQTYHDAANHDITGADAIRIQIVPGTSIQGVGRALATLRRA